MRFSLGHKTNVTHGHQTGGKSKTYQSWDGMIQRCLNPKNKKYPRYGGRGITVCARWQRFEKFLADMGERPVGKTIDRKNNDKGYSKRNCHWATVSEQNFNRAPKLIKFRGEKRTLGQWAKLLGVSKPAICRRISQGWTLEKTLTTSKYGRYGKELRKPLR